MSSTYLSIQGSYQNLHVGLYQGTEKIDSLNEQSVRVSSQFIPQIHGLLSRNQLTAPELSFIAIDKGPGAFTSLRVAITYVNALAYALHIPLVGIDGLQALARQSLKHFLHDSCSDITSSPTAIATLLNAYGNEVFVGAYSIENDTLISTSEHTNKNIDQALKELNRLFEGQQILFTGNGATLHAATIAALFATSINCSNHIQVASIDQIAEQGLELFTQEKSHTYKILPYYIKEQTFAVRKGC